MFETDYRVLSTMIAPALLMTATGSLILSSNNRLARVIDRIRVLISLVDAITLPGSTVDLPELRLDFYRQEISNLGRRASRIRTASAMLYLSFALFVAASLLVGIDLFLKVQVPSIPTSLAFMGAASLFSGSFNLFREIRTASRSVDLEIDFINRLCVGRGHAGITQLRQNASA